jgi:hypothetical protein
VREEDYETANVNELLRQENVEHVSDNRQATTEERCRCFGILFSALLKEGVM